MRTTIQLDDQLLAEAKKYAAESGRSLKSVIEDALREVLSRKLTQLAKKPVLLKTVNGDGLQPGIDIDDSATLQNSMES